MPSGVHIPRFRTTAERVPFERSGSARKTHRRSDDGEKLWTRGFVIGTLVNFFFSLNYFMLMVVMTAYAMDCYAAPASFAGFVASVFIIGTLFARLASAPLMDMLGRKRLLLAGAILVLATTALYFLPMPLFALIAVRFCHGFAYGLCSTCDATVVTAMVPAQRKGEGIGYFMLSATMGAAVGPSAGILVSRYLGYPMLFALAVAVIAVGIVGVAILRIPTSTTTGKARKIEDEEAVVDAEDAVAGVLSGAPEEAAREENAPVSVEAAAMEASTARGASKGDDRKTTVKTGGLLRFVEPKILPIASVCGLIFFGYSSLLTFLTPYAEEIGLTKAASVFFVAYAISMFLTRPFTGRAFDRFGAKPIMIPAFIAYMAGMILMSVTSNDWMLLGSALVLGYGIGTIQSCGLSMAVRDIDDTRLSVANATFYMLLDSGVGIGPIFLGMLVPLIGYSALYFCMCGVGVIALACFLLIARRSARKDLP